MIHHECDPEKSCALCQRTVSSNGDRTGFWVPEEVATEIIDLRTTIDDLTAQLATLRDERDEALLKAQQWQRAYDDLLMRMSARIINATGGNP